MLLVNDNLAVQDVIHCGLISLGFLGEYIWF